LGFGDILRQTVAWGGVVGAISWLATSPVASDTITQAIVKAYQNNPQLNSQRSVVRQTDELVPQALSGYRPTISATGTVGEQYQNSLEKAPGPNGGPI
jgi:outer membrane protein